MRDRKYWNGENERERMVDEVLSSYSYRIEFSCSDLLSCLDGIHTAGADTGLIGKLLYVLDIGQVEVVGGFGHLSR